MSYLFHQYIVKHTLKGTVLCTYVRYVRVEELYITIGSKIADRYVLSWLYNIPCPQIQPQHSKDIIDTSSNRKRIES